MISFHFTSFRSRILSIIIATILVSQISTYFLFNFIATKNAHYLIHQNLETTSRYFQDVIENKFNVLKDNANLVVGDFAFKRALATQDTNTIEVALLNLQTRIQADIMIAFNPYGKYLSLTADKEHDPQRSDNKKIEEYFSSLIEKSDKHGSEPLSAIIYWQKNAFQITVVPIKAPHLIAYIVIGHTINDHVASKVKDISTSDVTFLVIPAEQEYKKAITDAKIVGSSIAGGLGTEELKQLSSYQREDEQISFQKGSDTFIGQLVPIPQENDALVFLAVTQINLEEVLKNYTLYRPYISIMTFALIALSIPAALVISRCITTPIEKLVRGAERIEKGDYTRNIDITQKDEIGRLGRQLNRMSEGLAEREKMKYMAFHDSLTNLPNRRLFLQILEETLANNQNAALMMIDLDGFKLINDKYGHEAGDETLRQVSQRLREFVGHGEDTISRFGGDEFYILFNNQRNIRVISQKAQAIIELIEEPIFFGDLHLFVSASIGVNFTSKDIDASQWMKGADISCSEAKRAGKRTYKFFNQLYDHTASKNENRDESA